MLAKLASRSVRINALQRILMLFYKVFTWCPHLRSHWSALSSFSRKKDDMASFYFTRLTCHHGQFTWQLPPFGVLLKRPFLWEGGGGGVDNFVFINIINIITIRSITGKLLLYNNYYYYYYHYYYYYYYYYFYYYHYGEVGEMHVLSCSILIKQESVR